MKKLVALAGLCFLLGAFQLDAQRMRGGGGFRGFGHGGFGHRGFVGGGFRGFGHGGFIGGGFRGFGHHGFGHRGFVIGGGFGGFGFKFGHFGFPGFQGFHRFGFSPFFHHRGFFGSVGFPIFVGGVSYPYPYPYPYPAQPNVIVVYPQPAPETEGPQTIAEPERETSAAPARRNSIFFLIPLKDRSVRSGVAYWVEGETLHFITMDGKHDEVPLDQVDRKLAEELNRGREIEFRLPPEL